MTFPSVYVRVLDTYSCIIVHACAYVGTDCLAYIHEHITSTHAHPLECTYIHIHTHT